jgi:glycerate kinase
MRIMIAPAAYKGTMTPIQAARTISAGVGLALSDAELILAPIADGGTGWLDVWAFYLRERAQRQTVQVSDALGRTVQAEWLLLPSGTAILESAQACGIHFLQPDEYDPMHATSYGVGEMLRAAASHPDTRRIWLGLGGVATTDGGAGALSALGFKLLDRRGRPIPPGGAGLLRLAKVVPPDTPPLRDRPLLLCVDVSNPFLDAARVFASQKGATPEQVEQLLHGLQRFAEIALRDTGLDLMDCLGTGAAGGLAGGLEAYLHAFIKPGASWLMRCIRLPERLDRVDCVITGEGQVDAKTMMGKSVVRLVVYALIQRKQVVVLAGRKGPGWQRLACLPNVKVVSTRPTARRLRLGNEEDDHFLALFVTAAVTARELCQ